MSLTYNERFMYYCQEKIEPLLKIEKVCPSSSTDLYLLNYLTLTPPEINTVVSQVVLPLDKMSNNIFRIRITRQRDAYGSFQMTLFPGEQIQRVTLLECGLPVEFTNSQNFKITNNYVQRIGRVIEQIPEIHCQDLTQLVSSYLVTDHLLFSRANTFFELEIELNQNLVPDIQRTLWMDVYFVKMELRIKIMEWVEWPVL